MLAQWTITGTSTGPGGSIVSKTLIANDRNLASLRHRDVDKNTELSAGRINDAKSGADIGNLDQFIVLGKTHQGTEIVPGGGFPPPRPIEDFDVTHPIFSLSMVDIPRRNTVEGDPYDPVTDDINLSKFDIPYLEYQILSSNPISDFKSDVIGFAEFGGFRKEIRRSLKHPETLGGFVLETF